MDDNEIKKIIEAALFISGRSLTVEELAGICESGNLGKIRKIVENLMREYEERNGGIKIYLSENSYFMDVAEDVKDKVANLSPVKEISKNMIKILAFIAYHQPVKQKDVIEKFGYVYESILKLEELGFIKRYK
ncbi:MAG: SMC-Scp complex subunit ScpB, partial [Candidatus Altarchaeaceae archaeon]